MEITRGAGHRGRPSHHRRNAPTLYGQHRLAALCLSGQCCGFGSLLDADSRGLPPTPKDLCRQLFHNAQSCHGIHPFCYGADSPHGHHPPSGRDTTCRRPDRHHQNAFLLAFRTCLSVADHYHRPHHPATVCHLPAAQDSGHRMPHRTLSHRGLRHIGVRRHATVENVLYLRTTGMARP